MNKKGNGILNLAAVVLTVVVVFLLGRLGFSVFGFTFERPWQFVLFMTLFLALDTLFGELGDILGVKLVASGWLEGFWQVTLGRAMIDFLSELAILLLLRKLPGIEIPAMAAYRFAFCWGLADIAVSCWDEFKPGPS